MRKKAAKRRSRARRRSFARMSSCQSTRARTRGAAAPPSSVAAVVAAVARRYRYSRASTFLLFLRIGRETTCSQQRRSPPARAPARQPPPSPSPSSTTMKTLWFGVSRVRRRSNQFGLLYVQPRRRRRRHRRRCRLDAAAVELTAAVVAVDSVISQRASARARASQPPAGVVVDARAHF